MLFPIVSFLPYMRNRNSSYTYLHAYNVSLCGPQGSMAQLSLTEERTSFVS